MRPVLLKQHILNPEAFAVTLEHMMEGSAW
jgi:hypothetical protein